MFEKPRIGQELLDVPMGDMIHQMAIAIADAQRKLDENSIDTAQMMGGLETVTDPVTGEVTFTDSRVFFGKEKLLVPDAVTAHNLSTDLAFRASVREAMGAGNFTETNVVGATSAAFTLSFMENHTNTTFTADYPTAGAVALNLTDKIYRTGDGSHANPYQYYKFTGTDSSSDRVYTEVSQYSTNIAKASTLSDDSILYVPSRLSMLELGFTPTFYQFVDTIIEVKISIKYTQDGSQVNSSGSSNFNKNAAHGGLRGLIFGGKNNKTVTTSHVNAAYSQKYSYSAEGSSLLRTKLVPIPPPAILEERIRLQMDILKESAAPETTTT